MNLIVDLINIYKKEYPEFEYYLLHVKKINSNKSSYPDIAIETCKSFIEGVSKTILIKLDSTFDEKSATSGRNPKSVQQLFRLALEKISKYNMNFEESFVHSSGQIVNVISNIRTERGDISHGKSVPKINNSTPEFAEMLANVTEQILVYVLNNFFQIKISEKLNYDNLEEYNNWLDESLDFPIRKAIYSKVLYENDYDEYEQRYKDEYLSSIEINEDLRNGILEILEILKTNKKEYKIEVNQIDIPFAKEEIKEEFKKVTLVAKFNDGEFWNRRKIEYLEKFTKLHDFDFEKIKKIVEDSIAFENNPMKDDVRKALKRTLLLSEFRTLLPQIVDEVIHFINEIKKW